jgi:hypothetical protein
VITYLLTHRAKLTRLVIFISCALLVLTALQAAVFFQRISPRVATANTQLFELMVEETQHTSYRALAVQIEHLKKTAPEAEREGRALSTAWDDFQNHFSAAPQEALETLHDALPVLTATFNDEFGVVGAAVATLQRLRSIYADSYKPLLADLRSPPIYMWPTASIAASAFGIRDTVMLNRALYLAQVGEIGTARVMLAGLNASVDDSVVLAKVYYTLGRLQFELFRSTPEAEYFTQSVQYLRQSLNIDPESQQAKHLLDYLLSLSQTPTAPQSAEGRPETPSEGEGAAVSAEKRIF